jgi:hypothetical protein
MSTCATGRGSDVRISRPGARPPTRHPTSLASTAGCPPTKWTTRPSGTAAESSTHVGVRVTYVQEPPKRTRAATTLNPKASPLSCPCRCVGAFPVAPAMAS